MGCSGSKKQTKPDNSIALGETTFSPRYSVRAAASVTSAGDLKISPGTFIQYLSQPFTSRYRVIRELGSGQFGKVYLAEHRNTHERRAVKEIEKNRAEKLGGSQSRFISEVEIISRLDHPNIIKLYEMFEDTKRYYLVSELCTGGELFDYVTSKGHLSEVLAADIMRQVLSAVNYCHRNHIVHRDLKPENLLLDTPPRESQPLNIKVIDFGTSCLLAPNQKLKQRLGTAYYIAPEVLSMNYTEKCDVWSCGVILFILLSGAPPFGGQTDEDILRRVKTGKFSFAHESWRTISEAAKSLIRKMLTMDPRQRISAQECLDDEWIRTFCTQQAVTTHSVVFSLNNLKAFTAEQKLKQAFLAFISSQMMTKELEKQLSASFRAIDKNGDGKLSRDELLEAYGQLMPAEEALSTVEKIMSNVDSDRSGYIDYSEFVLATANYTALLSKSNLEAAFNAFDKDGSGKISAEELKVMLDAGSVVNESVWQELIREADQNGDGEIEFKEFSRLLLHAVAQQGLP
jgi:calcium-dependent protein kinase